MEYVSIVEQSDARMPEAVSSVILRKGYRICRCCMLLAVFFWLFEIDSVTTQPGAQAESQGRPNVCTIRPVKRESARPQIIDVRSLAVELAHPTKCIYSPSFIHEETGAGGGATERTLLG